LPDIPKLIDTPLPLPKTPGPKPGVTQAFEKERKQYIAAIAEKDARINQLEKQVRRLERTVQKQLDE
jgi:hypothetical protein